MYFRNKFDEEFLYLAEHISPKGGSVKLDNGYPNFFIFERPAFDEEGRYIVVKPILLYNEIITTNPEDKIIEDYIVLCKNNKDTVITCKFNPKHPSKQEEDYICNLNYININGDMIPYDDYQTLYYLPEHPEASEYSPDYEETDEIPRGDTAVYIEDVTDNDD